MDRDWGKLGRWMIKKKLEGGSVTAICSEAQIDRKMFCRWWNRYQTQGWKGLEEKARGHPVGSGIDDLLKQKVIKLVRGMNGVPARLSVACVAKASGLTITKPTKSSVKPA